MVKGLMERMQESIADPFISRRTAADEITAEFFPTSFRQLATWKEVPVTIITGLACARRSEWHAAAKARLDNQLAKQGAEVPRYRAARNAHEASVRARAAKAQVSLVK